MSCETNDFQCAANALLGTLRYETRRLLDAAGSKFSQTREVAHVQSVVLLVSRRVEDVGWRGLAFCVKREYFFLLEFMKMMLNSSKHVKLVAKNHMFS